MLNGNGILDCCNTHVAYIIILSSCHLVSCCDYFMQHLYRQMNIFALLSADANITFVLSRKSQAPRRFAIRVDSVPS